eukprot:9467565-Alexandrium_andersonii.AAC.1
MRSNNRATTCSNVHCRATWRAPATVGCSLWVLRPCPKPASAQSIHLNDNSIAALQPTFGAVFCAPQGARWLPHPGTPCSPQGATAPAHPFPQ